MDWSLLDIGQAFLASDTPPAGVTDGFYIIVSDDEILAPEKPAPWQPLDQTTYNLMDFAVVSEHFLGCVHGIPIHVIEVDPDEDEPQGHEFRNLWSFLGRITEAEFHLLGRARQIIDWHRNHQFCGQCGQPTVRAETDRSTQCKPCRQAFYPRLSPSIIVLVTRGEELLLARNARGRGNFYSTLAGFVEPGETLEEAVHREVKEEVGITVKNLQYFRSQPWPFPNSLMLGFHAEYAGGDLVLQEDEIADAQWFHYTNLPNDPAMVSISGWLINDYIKRLEQS